MGFLFGPGPLTKLSRQVQFGWFVTNKENLWSSASTNTPGAPLLAYSPIKDVINRKKGATSVTKFNNAQEGFDVFGGGIDDLLDLVICARSIRLNVEISWTGKCMIHVYEPSWSKAYEQCGASEDTIISGILILWHALNLKCAGNTWSHDFDLQLV